MNVDVDSHVLRADAARFQGEADHAAEVTHLRNGDVVSAVRFPSPGSRPCPPRRGLTGTPQWLTHWSSDDPCAHPGLEATKQQVAVEGPRHRADRVLVNRNVAANASSFVATNPPRTSECPPRTWWLSAPRRPRPRLRVRCKYGVANVLSTTNIAPCSWATSLRAEIETTLATDCSGSRARSSWLTHQ